MNYFILGFHFLEGKPICIPVSNNLLIDTSSLYFAVVALSEAYHLLYELGKKDGKALFVGTKG